MYYFCFVTLSHYNWSNQSDSVVCKPRSRAVCGGGICHIHTDRTPEVQQALYPVLELQILEVHDIHLHYVYKVIHEIYPNYIGFFVHTPKKSGFRIELCRF